MGLAEICREVGALPDLDDGARLELLLGRWWEHELADRPETATMTGAPGHDDRWIDLSEEAIERRRSEAGAPLAVLDLLGRVPVASELDLELARRRVAEAVLIWSRPEELLAVDQLHGAQHTVPTTLGAMDVGRARGQHDYVARLRALPPLVAQTIDLLRRGISAGVTQSAVVLRDVPDQVAALIPADPWASPLLKPLAAVRAAVGDAAERAYRDAAAPSFAELERFLRTVYLPAARTDPAWSALADGEAWYAERVQRFTTTSLTPVEVHDLGLSEVARIRSEMDACMAAAGWRGDFSGWCERLRTDPRWFHTSPDALLAEYRDIAKRIDPELPRLFGHLPRLPYGVAAIPSFSERSQTTAYYLRGAPEAGRPGWFFANTYDLPSRPRWEMEALTAHEAVPGHHLQIAIAQELEGLSPFRRNPAYTAFVEGWGLYAESLGSEIGLYQTPESRFGQLVYEMWRAVRLVVDTGMHVLGWDRDRAIAFFVDNSAKAVHDVTVEIDRYLAWPGQALAYKIGERTIRGLRSEAEEALGTAFDVRAFHDVVLSAGALPLDLLTERVRAWIGQPGR